MRRGFRDEVRCLGIRVWGLGLGLGFRVQDLTQDFPL